MIHYVHVVHVDPERAAAVGKAFTMFFVAWLVWHFLPGGWSILNGWLGGWLDMLWHLVALPFVWLNHILHSIAFACSWMAGAVDSAFRVAAKFQAVLFPVWALLAGWCLGRGDDKDGSILWLGAAGLNAVCTALQGYPLMAVVVVVGSTAAFVSTMVLASSLRSWVGWLAAVLVAGLSSWGIQRYGTAYLPVCWLLVPLSWCCLALGAAYGVRREAGGWLRDREAVRLLLLASVVAMAAFGPLAVNVARAALLTDGTPMTAAPSAPAVAMDGLVGREIAGSAGQVRQQAPASVLHRSGQDIKPASPLQSKHPRA